MKNGNRGWFAVRSAMMAAVLVTLTAGGGWGFQNDPVSSEAVTPGVTSRQAEHAVIITLKGEIDDWTAVSVERRIKEAEEAGADAIVIELDTPGGGVGATLRISNAIKGSSIGNTVAWVHPDAYSGGAIVALACSRIVIGEPAAIGDAFQVIPVLNEEQNRGGLRAPTAVERTKILTVIMSDVGDSARRNGVDEFLVQAMVIDGVELWLVERGQTGEYVAINEQEYRLIFNSEPPRGKPELAGVTGGRYAATATGPVEQSDEPISLPVPMKSLDDASSSDGEDPQAERYEYLPASETLRDVEAAFNDGERLDLGMSFPTRRPNFVAMTDDERAEFRLAAYLTDGTSAVILRGEDAIRYGIAWQVVRDDTELASFFGGASLTRTEMSGFELFARFLSSGPVKFMLIVMLFIGFAIDIVSPGLVLPTVVWVGAMVALLAPPMVVGMAGWWEVAAILVGLGALVAEIFVLPGFGIFGVIGLLSLFAGLVGTFIPNGPVLPGATSASDGLMWGVSTVLLSGVTAGIGVYFISKRFETFPILNKMVLTTVSGQARDETDRDAMLSAMRETGRDLIAAGDEGVAQTVLRPSGTALINDTMVDVVSDLGYIEKGDAVRVVRAEGMRCVVEKINPGDDSGTGPGAEA